MSLVRSKSDFKGVPFHMGRPRKKAQDLTTDEVMRKLFPKKAVDRAKKETETKPRKPRNKDDTE